MSSSRGQRERAKRAGRRGTWAHTPHTCTHIYIQHMVSHRYRDPHTHTRAHTRTGVQKPTRRERPVPCVCTLSAPHPDHLF